MQELEVTGVYKIGFTNTDKVYIGSSSNVARRWKQHIALLSNDCHHSFKLQKYFSIASNSSKIYIEVLEETDEEDKFFIEKYYIEKYNAIEEGFNVAQLSSLVCETVPELPSEIVVKLTDKLSIKESYLLSCLKYWVTVCNCKNLPLGAIAKKVRFSESSAKSFIKTLEALGYIKVIRSTNRKFNINSYEIV